MAKRRKKRGSKAQRAAWARQQRGPSGRFLSKAQIAQVEKERFERLRDLAFVSPEQYARIQATNLRSAEVKREKVERRKRFKRSPSAYQYKHKPDKRTLEAQSAINDGRFPRPNQTISHGELTEYVWTWQGQHALQTAQDFLLLAIERMPSDTQGYLSLGNGHGKNALWIGTRLGNPREIWRHSQTFLTSKSGNTQALNQQAIYTSDSVSLWAEVTLTAKGEVKFDARKRQTSKKGASR